MNGAAARFVPPLFFQGERFLDPGARARPGVDARLVLEGSLFTNMRALELVWRRRAPPFSANCRDL
jgi:hypothetical protein